MPARLRLGVLTTTLREPEGLRDFNKEWDIPGIDRDLLNSKKKKFKTVHSDFAIFVDEYRGTSTYCSMVNCIEFGTSSMGVLL